MGLFGGKNRSSRNGSFDKVPDIGEKVAMIFKDVKTDGKKRGYKKAAVEYEKAFKAIEEEQKSTKEFFERQKNSFNVRSEVLIFKLESLETQKKELENQVKQKNQEVSIKYKIPLGRVEALTNATITGGPLVLDFLRLIYIHKDKKLREAEQEGYTEAKKDFDIKTTKLKSDLMELKNKGSKEIEEYINMIGDLFDAISDEHMKIAELEILLKRGENLGK